MCVCGYMDLNLSELRCKENECQNKRNEILYFILSIHHINNKNILQYFLKMCLENSNYTNKICTVSL